jgi:cob(I)alamin adenosyltransferase
MLVIFTGDGKGKTTAAIGQALRAVGRGKRALMVQFIKGPWVSGEDVAQERLAPDFKIVKMGKGFVGIGGDPLPFKEHKKAAEEALAFAFAEAATGAWNLLILDEITNAVGLGLIHAREVLAVVGAAREHVDHIVLTGRNAPQEFIEAADLVTEMKEVKHPFKNGIPGMPGLEY